MRVERKGCGGEGREDGMGDIQLQGASVEYVAGQEGGGRGGRRRGRMEGRKRTRGKIGKSGMGPREGNSEGQAGRGS